MKLIHLSDLHLGKRIANYSMMEDQEHILARITEIVRQEHPDAVLIAGDVYDRSAPSDEAIRLLSHFLTGLAAIGKPVFVSSGNHDSAQKLDFLTEVIRLGGIYFSPVYNGTITPVTLHDEHGPVNVYMLPFIKPTSVRQAFPEEEITSYTDALRVAISHMDIRRNERNILVAHQFVRGSHLVGSEELIVGGLDEVDASVFEAFDYVALGHLHGPQNVNKHIRYSGSPLKYSIDEADDKKSVTIVEVGTMAEVKITTLPLQPLRDWQDLRGRFDDIHQESNRTDDYVRVTLTDEAPIPNDYGLLKNIFPNLISFGYDNEETRTKFDFSRPTAIDSKQPIELIGEFFAKQTGSELSPEQLDYLTHLLDR